jgi:hypothetical protein
MAARGVRRARPERGTADGPCAAPVPPLVLHYWATVRACAPPEHFAWRAEGDDGLVWELAYCVDPTPDGCYVTNSRSTTAWGRLRVPLVGRHRRSCGGGGWRGPCRTTWRASKPGWPCSRARHFPIVLPDGGRAVVVSPTPVEQIVVRDASRPSGHRVGTPLASGTG